MAIRVDNSPSQKAPVAGLRIVSRYGRWADHLDWLRGASPVAAVPKPGLRLRLAIAIERSKRSGKLAQLAKPVLVVRLQRIPVLSATLDVIRDIVRDLRALLAD